MDNRTEARNLNEIKVKRIKRKVMEIESENIIQKKATQTIVDEIKDYIVKEVKRNDN